MTAPTFDIMVEDGGEIVSREPTIDDALLQLSLIEDEEMDNGTYIPDRYIIVRNGYAVYTKGKNDDFEIGAFTELEAALKLARNYTNAEIRYCEVWTGDGSLVAWEGVSE